MSDPQNNQPVFSIEKVYVKDLSLEIPNAPQVFLERDAPMVDIQLHHNSTGVEQGVYETVLTVTVTAKANDKTLFLVEVAQAGGLRPCRLSDCPPNCRFQASGLSAGTGYRK